MLVRNLLKAGQFVSPIPFGLPITLKYKETGNLECAFIGYDASIFQDNKTLKKSKSVYSSILKHSKVPAHVGTGNGTLYVKGVIYTSRHFETLGTFPTDYLDELETFVGSNSNFNFFASSVESTSINFSGAAQIRTWLQVQGFNVLPGLIVPMGDVELAVKRFVDTTPFNYEWLSGFCIFEGSNTIYQFLDNKQDKISNIEIYLDASGHVRSYLTLNSNKKLSVSYYELIHNDYKVNDYVILNSESSILNTFPRKLNSNQVKATFECPFCGKIYYVNDEFAMCPNPHCFSRMYTDIIHFLNQLNLPTISYERYLNLIDEKVITKFSDILLADEFRDMVIETSFFDIINAVIPISEVRNRDCIWNLCVSCHNSWDSICYYLDHPLFIATDLNICDSGLQKWLQDSKNVDAIKEIVQYSNITIIDSVKKFNGAPILRNAKIYLSGKFKHGNTEEVSAILRSYAASIVGFEEANCAILGDIPDNVNGGAISYISNRGYPVFTELEFFEKYQIDEDLC